MKILRRYLRSVYVRGKFYHLHRSPSICDNMLLMIIKDGYRKKHPGLVDRFKAIIGLYYIAKQNRRNFKLIFTTPFDLSEYLVPNETNWIINTCDIDYNILQTKLLEYNAFKQVPMLNPKVKQYHCYFYEGFNILQKNNISNWKDEWRRLFCELFKPSNRLESLLMEMLPIDSYVAVHFRFVNALDNFEKGYNNYISKSEQDVLIAQCMEKLLKIRENEQTAIYVFSDSSRFLKIAENSGYKTLGTENIGHVSFESERESYDRTFVDFFAISKATKVYAVHGSVLYNSVFPCYAAIVGNAPYITIEL